MPQEKLKIGVNTELLKKNIQSYAAELKAEIFLVQESMDIAHTLDIIFANDDFIQKLKFSSTSRPSVFVCVGDQEQIIPSSYVDGHADDIFVLPARRLDFFAKLRLHENIKALRELENSSVAIPELVAKLQEDLLLAQKIQRRLIRDKFPTMGAVNIKSKYWCGLKSGGDYFDVFEFSSKNHIGVLLTDSSSYSLSTKFLSSLMQLTGKNIDDSIALDPTACITNLFGAIRDEMKPKDNFSIFYAVIDKKTYCMNYVNCGSAKAYVCGEKKQWLTDGMNSLLTKENPFVPKASELVLEPSDRFVLFSDGWSNAFADKSVPEFIEKNAKMDPQSLVNEMSFQMRKQISSEEEDSMPPEDCSLLIFDIAKNTLRLAK